VKNGWVNYQQNGLSSKQIFEKINRNIDQHAAEILQSNDPKSHFTKY
jgi:hypothetical protein